MDLPLHPALVHLPLGLALITPLIMLGTLVAWWRGVLPRKAWGIPVTLLAVMAAGCLAAQRTGEEDAYVVKELVAHELIEAHEEASERFTFVAFFTLAFGAVVLGVPGERMAQGIALGATGLSLVTAGLGMAAGHEGGELVYVHGAAQGHELQVCEGEGC